MLARLKKRMGRKSQSDEGLDQDFFKLIPFETSAQIFSFLTHHEAASVATTCSLFLSLYKDKLALDTEKNESELCLREKEIVNANAFFSKNKVRDKFLIKRPFTYYDFDKEFNAARHFYVLGDIKKGRKHFFNALNSIKYDLYIDRDNDVDFFFHKHVKFGNINIKSNPHFFTCCYRKIMDYIAIDKEGSEHLYEVLQREVIFYIEKTAHFSDDKKWDQLKKIVHDYHKKEILGIQNNL